MKRVRQRQIGVPGRRWRLFHSVAAIRLFFDVDRGTCLVDIGPDDGRVLRTLTLFLILNHGQGRIRPLVPPLVPLAIDAGVLLGAIGEVNLAQGAFVGDALERRDDLGRRPSIWPR